MNGSDTFPRSWRVQRRLEAWARSLGEPRRAGRVELVLAGACLLVGGLAIFAADGGIVIGTITLVWGLALYVVGVRDLRHVAPVFLLALLLMVPTVRAEYTTDTPPLTDTPTIGTPGGFGRLASDDGAEYVFRETCAPFCVAQTDHDWDAIAWGDVLVASLIVRANLSDAAEVFTLSVYDWQDALFVPVITVGAVDEQTYTRVLNATCGSAASDCWIDTDADLPIRVRWSDSNPGDGVATELHADLEVVRVLRADRAEAFQFESVLGFLLVGLLFAFGFRVPAFWVFAGMGLIALAFPVYAATGATWLLILTVGAGISLFFATLITILGTEEYVG